MLKVLKWILKAGLIGTILGIISLIALYLYLSPSLPDASKLKEFQLQTPLKVYSQDGKLISQYGEKKRIPLAFDEIPIHMRQAFLAIEDSRFYVHPGIDPIGIGRAVINLIVTGKKGQGASTITQQVARNYFLTREKTYIRKIREVFLALNIEQALTKDEILLAYLNKIPLGHRSFGVGAAAQVYYGKKVNELTLAQIAVIAGLPKAPSSLNPIRSPSRAKARRNLVLGRMLDLQFINQEQYQEAVNAPITAKRHGAKIELYAPYLGEMVRAHMVNTYGREAAYSTGFNVYTTVNSRIQTAAQSAVATNIINYDQRHGYRGPERQIDIDALIAKDQLDSQVIDNTHLNQIISSPLKNIKNVRILLPAIVKTIEEQSFIAVLKTGESISIPWDNMKWARRYIDDDHQGKAPSQSSDIVARGDVIRVFKRNDLWHLSQIPEVSSALVSLDPHDGAIRSIIGGFDFKRSQFNRVTQAKRQIGSNIKPFLYSYAMDRNFTLASIINDVPITQWDRSQGAAWRPKNSPPIYNGPTRLRLGLSQSKNVMSVKLIQKLGIKNTINHMTKFGFQKDELPIGESLALGSASVTPLEAATGYATFANGGFLVTPYYIERINDANNNSIIVTEPLIACAECETAEKIYIAAFNDTDSLSTDFLNQQCMVNKSRIAPRVISQQNAFLVREMMQSVITGGGNWSKKTGWSGTAWRVANTIKRKDIGGKTGTTNDSKDAWFSGISPNLVASTWIGFDNPSRALGKTRANSNLGRKQIKGAESGAKSAMPAWIDFMNVALQDYPEQPKKIPANIKTVRIDITTGLLTTKTDHTSRFEYFLEGTQPTKYIDSVNIKQQSRDNTTDNHFDDDIF